MKTVRLKVDYLTRVEGEGALHVRIREGMVQEVQLRIFEPPRFFESFLRGRRFSEVPDLTARICGICPIAYQMSAVHALENAFGMRITGPLRALRRLVYCGEWIESHALSVYMLHAPDFLGYSGAIEMAGTHTDAVKRGLRLKKAGNEILALLGGRDPSDKRACRRLLQDSVQARSGAARGESEMGERGCAGDCAMGRGVRFSRSGTRL